MKLPAGAGDDHKITILAVAENEFGKTEVEATVTCRPKRFNTSDFDDIAGKMSDMEDEGVSEEILVFVFSIVSSAEVVPGVHLGSWGYTACLCSTTIPRKSGFMSYKHPEDAHLI